MSRTKISCRACQKPLAAVHHGGGVRFSFNVVRSFDPAGPHGPCLWLQCGCGAMRSFDLLGDIGPPNELVVKE